MIRERLADLAICGIDPAIKEETIRLRRTKKMKLPDAIVAATAIVNDATLVTNDIALQRTPGLHCQTLVQKT